MKANVFRRIAQLERLMVAIRQPRILMRFEGPGSEKFKSPTQEEIDAAGDVMVIQFVEAKDGRPA